MYQGSVCDWKKQILNQSEALPMTWVMTRRQNGILRSFLRRHLAGKTTTTTTTNFIENLKIPNYITFPPANSL